MYMAYVSMFLSLQQLLSVQPSSQDVLEDLHCFLFLFLQMYVNLLFWYQFFCGFSGSVMTNSWVLILFNLIFTSVPPLVYGILDQDIGAETLMEVPELYRLVRSSKVIANTKLDYFL